MSASLVGCWLLGTVLGYLTHFLVRRTANPGIGDLAAIIGVIAGGTVLKVVSGGDQMSWYLIGLGVGFFLFWAALLAGKEQQRSVKGIDPTVMSERPLKLFPFLR